MFSNRFKREKPTQPLTPVSKSQNDKAIIACALALGDTYKTFIDAITHHTEDLTASVEGLETTEIPIAGLEAVKTNLRGLNELASQTDALDARLNAIKKAEGVTAVMLRANW